MTIFVLLVLYSCKNRNKINTLPVDKLYILEYTYIRDYEKRNNEFYVAGFCELDKDFNIRYVMRLYFNSNFYYNSIDVVPDSLRSKISNILLKYQADTTFLYQGEPRPTISSGGHPIRFIIQKHDQKDITIKFVPEFLPEDLKFVYSYLYENRTRTEHKSTYNELFRMFEEQVKNNPFGLLPPFPPIGASDPARYIPPVIIDEE